MSLIGDLYYIFLIVMLARAISKRLNLVFRNKAAFSSGHGHDDHGHGHHDYSVAVNKESPWIKYKSV